MSPIVLILQDIRSAENVGSIFRTAEAAGVSKIYLTGYTPAPLDRFERKNTKLAKAALGAEMLVSWETAPDSETLIARLKKEKILVVAVEQDEASIPYTSLKLGGAVALIFGNEVSGISKNILARAERIIEIPMQGKKESLNVSVAAGIILFALCNRV